MDELKEREIFREALRIAVIAVVIVIPVIVLMSLKANYDYRLTKAEEKIEQQGDDLAHLRQQLHVSSWQVD